MRRWYSPRGARRGVLIATLAAALWTSWAMGYIQGASRNGSDVPNAGATPTDSGAAHARGNEI